MRITKRELKQYITECVKEVIRERRLFETVNSDFSTDDLIKKSTDEILPYVDLGYGLKFAKCNLGAEKPEEYGLYFQWGEIEGHNFDEISIDFEKTKKLSSIKNLDAEHDAATQMLGSQWRLPTEDELKMLTDNRKFESKWTQFNGVNGRKYISKENGNSIFIPASGFFAPNFTDKGKGTIGEQCEIWSCTLCRDFIYRPYALGFDSYFDSFNGMVSEIYGNSRCTIRPIFIG